MVVGVDTMRVMHPSWGVANSDADADTGAGAGAAADADAEYRDELPGDLDPRGYVGPYTFPDNKRRRVPGLLYLAVGAACLVWWATAGAGSVLVNRGTAGVGALLIV